MIRVYFESNTHAELIAVFESEDIYLSCVPALENLAQERGVFLTESIEEEMILANF
jgi:hypothetical protein